MTTGRGVGSIIFDLDGVVYIDTHGVPGAGVALTKLEEHGWQILFATNNSTKTQDMVAAHIAERTGYPARPAQAITSSMAAVTYATARHETALVVGPPALVETARDAGLRLTPAAASELPPDRPDCVIVGLDRDISYVTIDRAARAIRDGAEFIATNVDPTYPTPTGLAPGAGAIVAAVATASGTQPLSCGKPSHLFGELVRRRLEHDDVWVVGDRSDTDVALARANGWSSILVLTGVTSDAALEPPEMAADAVLRSIVDVPGYLESVTGDSDGG